MIELQDCINFRLTKAQLAVYQVFKENLLEFDVTPVQCGVLLCLYIKDGQELSSIAEKLCMTGSTMTGVIDRMEAKKLIERRTSSNDRRALVIYMKEKGKNLEKKLTKTIFQANEWVLKSFSDDEARTLKDMLLRLAGLTSK